MMTEELPATAPDLLNPLLVRINRATIRACVVRSIICPLSKVVLDMRRAVHVRVLRDGQTIGAQTYDGRAWDGTQGATIRQELAKHEGLTIAALDGREWWASDAQRVALVVVDAHGSAEVGAKTDQERATVSRGSARALVAVGLLVEYAEDGTNYVHRPVDLDAVVRVPETEN